MKIGLIGGAVLALFAGVAHAGPQRFNLECVGSEKTFNDKGESDAEWKRTFAIDLVGRRAWVVGAKTPFGIEATATTISLKWDEDTEINRTTGELTSEHREKLIHWNTFTKATCKPLPYTPIPEAQF